MKMINNLAKYSRYVLTWLFVLILKRKTIEETEKVDIDGECVTIYRYRSKKPEFAQTTPIGTIIWNQNRTEGLSEDARQLVLSHEKSHADRNPVWKGLLYGSVINLAVVSVVVPKLILRAVSADFSLVPMGQIIGVGFLFITVFLLLFRIEETLADYHALQQLGEKRFTRGYEELSESGSGGTVSGLLRTVLYTSPSQTLKLHRLVEQYN
jgi:Zn-dependent protease with chaperone function